ncbi:ABC transporter permease [Peptoniphilus catoniae]|uniref:ABC transporter permease n=1 Tax=Peptoniphilus catoniae TaxID=1660341 RepID=UPI0010FCFEDC|nr:FtsX-like permease family protein [Peptoniphilus catoniae]
MRSKDLIQMAFRNLSNRKTRTFLTVLGVIIGTSSIIVMLSIGFGFSRINRALLGNVNLNVLNLQLYDYGNVEGDSNALPKKSKPRNDTAVSEVKKVPHVKAVMPMYSGDLQLVSGRLSGGAQFKSVDPSAMEDFGYEVEEGRLLTNQDNKSGMVLGSYVTKGFYDPKRANVDSSNKVKPMTSRIEVKGMQVYDESEMRYGPSSQESESPVEEQKEYKEKIKVVGVLKEDQGDWENSNTIFITNDYLKNLYKNYAKPGKSIKDMLPKEYNEIKVLVDKVENVEQVQEDISNLGYCPINYRAESMKAQNQQLIVVQLVFGAIGGIAFLVAAIGISNTMIMSIYERTKEIGVMKVIGASIKDIKKLFLVEAGFIGLIGGTAGIILSLIISFGINFFTKGYFSYMEEMHINPKLSYIPWWLIFIALIFSTMIGVLSGYLPARKAMKISALDAIRSE